MADSSWLVTEDDLHVHYAHMIALAVSSCRQYSVECDAKGEAVRLLVLFGQLLIGYTVGQRLITRV